MKKAGSEKVLNEINRQLSEFIESKKRTRVILLGGIQLKYVYRVIAISMIILLLSTGCHMNEIQEKGIR